MFIFASSYLWLYSYVFKFSSLHLRLYICTSFYLRLYICDFIFICLYICDFVFTSFYLCLYICVFIYMSLNIHTYVCNGMYARTMLHTNQNEYGFLLVLYVFCGLLIRVWSWTTAQYWLPYNSTWSWSYEGIITDIIQKKSPVK